MTEKVEMNKFHLTFKLGFYGGVAQLGEHLPCTQGVAGSIPVISTIKISLTIK